MALLKHENGPFDITIGDKKGQQNTDSILEMTPTVAQKISVFLGYFSAVELLTPLLALRNSTHFRRSSNRDTRSNAEILHKT